MAYVVTATWVARYGTEDAVAQALRELAVCSRNEPGNLVYIPFRDPADARVFGIFEVYRNETTFKSHLESRHFVEIAQGRAIPLLANRRRFIFDSLE